MFWPVKKPNKVIDAKTAREMALLKKSKKDLENIEQTKRIETAIKNAHSKSVAKIFEFIENSSKNGSMSTTIYCSNITWLNSLYSEECEILCGMIIKTFEKLGYSIYYENKKPGSFNEFGKFEIRWDNDPERG